MIWGANLALFAVLALVVSGVVAACFNAGILDFVKANFGLLVLLLLFLTLLAVSFHVFHESSQQPIAKDFLSWLEQKAGEVLASIMTVIVGARAANGRTGDTKNGNGNGTSATTTTGAVNTGHP
jgi:hypothetical protein